MTYHAKITSYNYQIVDGQPAIVMRSIKVFNENGDFIRQADLKKITQNLQNMTVTFEDVRKYKTINHMSMHTLLNNATGEYLPEVDKEIVLDWFVRSYPDEYRKLQNKFDQISLDKEKKAIIFTMQGNLISAVEGIEL